jgi:hypothetical protein
LKDVLDAIAKLPTKDDLQALRAEAKSEIASLRAEMVQRFDDLDAEPTKHADVHRKVEEDITRLKGRPPRTAARPARSPRTR